MSPGLDVADRVRPGVWDVGGSIMPSTNPLEFELGLNPSLFIGLVPGIAAECSVVGQSDEVETLRGFVDEDQGWRWQFPPICRVGKADEMSHP